MGIIDNEFKLAFDRGDEAQCLELLEAGADPNIRIFEHMWALVNDDLHPLSLAILKGMDKLAPALIASGAQLDFEPEAIINPLHAAAYMANTFVLQKCLAAGVKQKNSRLGKLSEYFDLMKIECKVCCGAIIDDPLHTAVYRSAPENVRLLVEHGFVDRLKGCDNGGVFISLARAMTVDLRNEMYNSSLFSLDNEEDARREVLEGYKEIGRILKKARFWTEQKDYYGNTAMHHLARNNASVELYDYFRELGVWTDAINDSSESALSIALETQNIPLAERIIKRGENPNFTRGGLGTPLHYAISDGNMELFNILRAAGADINAKNPYGDTPLMLATTNAREEMFLDLLKAGAEMKTKNNNGKTIFTVELTKTQENEKIREKLEELMPKKKRLFFGKAVKAGRPKGIGFKYSML